MKSIEIYKTNKDYKICTLYKLESGSYISSKPIFILPYDVEVNDFNDKIFEALNASRNLLESEENKFWLGNSLLKELKETSFNKLYRTSTSCMVTFIGGIIRIIPRGYLGEKQGLSIDEDQALQIKLEDKNNFEIINKIKQMLSLT